MSTSGPPSEVAAAAAPLPPLPAQQCPHCSSTTPAGHYCGVCGGHLLHPEANLAARRPHAFAAFPEEPVFRLSLTSSLFPHLSHRSAAPFRVGFGLLVALLVVFSATNLEAPVIALSAMGVPLLFQLYIYEVDLYEREHLRLAALTLIVGAGLGVGWAVLGGHVVSHALQPTLGESLAGYDVLKAAVFVPVIGEALMLVPLVLALVMLPGFGSRRESLDGFALGAASALGFSFAAVITDMASRLSAGLAPSRPFTSILTEALIRGVATPVAFAAGTGLIGASIWVRRAEVGAVKASGRWLTNPVLILVCVLVLEVGLGFADQARLADIPLLAVHLAGTAVLLLALRVGIHHILLHEQHEVVIGPAVACPQCHHLVPSMPFCPSCGVAQVATSKRQRAGSSAGDPWPVLPVGTEAAWAGFPLTTVPVPRAQRPHHTLLVGMFVAGLAAISVALVLTALTQEPDTKPVQRCHDGLCPGTSGASLTGAALGPPVEVYRSPDGHFSLGLFTNGLYRSVSARSTASMFSLTYQPTTVSTPKGQFSLQGGEVQVADAVTSSGDNAETVVNAVVSQIAPSAQMAYPIDALVGNVPGYGAVYDADVNSSSGAQIDYRLVVMAAIRNGIAVVIVAIGPEDLSFESLPFLDHPSFLDLDVDLNFSVDLMANSVQWGSSQLAP